MYIVWFKMLFNQHLMRLIYFCFTRHNHNQQNFMYESVNQNRITAQVQESLHLGTVDCGILKKSA